MGSFVAADHHNFPPFRPPVLTGGKKKERCWRDEDQSRRDDVQRGFYGLFFFFIWGKFARSAPERDD